MTYISDAALDGIGLDVNTEKTAKRKARRERRREIAVPPRARALPSHRAHHNGGARIAA